MEISWGIYKLFFLLKDKKQHLYTKAQVEIPSIVLKVSAVFKIKQKLCCLFNDLLKIALSFSYICLYIYIYIYQNCNVVLMLLLFRYGFNFCTGSDYCGDELVFSVSKL